MATLLDKAKSTIKIYTREDHELVKAWLHGTIGFSHIRNAKEMKDPHSVYRYIAFVCREVYTSEIK